MSIFSAVSSWCSFNGVEGSEASKILQCVRLPLIDMKVLLNTGKVIRFWTLVEIGSQLKTLKK